VGAVNAASRRHGPWFGALMTLVCLWSATPLLAQPAFPGGGSSSVAADSARDAELDAMTAVIASKLRCPVCRGQSVQESSAQLAREMQAIIRQKLEAGETPEQIEEFFLASYGDFILLKPRARGLSALVYALPVAGFLLAFVTIALRMRPGKGSKDVVVVEAVAGGASVSASTLTKPDLPPEDREWLDAEIRGDS